MDKKFSLSRRNFLGTSAAAFAAMAFAPSLSSCAASDGQKEAAAPVSDGKPHSDFGGVHFGAITYSWRDMPGGLDNQIAYCKQANVSNLELMGSDLEVCLGAPESPMMAIYQALFARLSDDEKKAMMSGKGRPQLNADEQAQVDDYNKKYAEFKANMDWNKVEEVRKRFESEGINIHIVKTEPSRAKTDEEIDYAFRLAKAMGAKGVTDEISLESAQRMAPFAEKYDICYCMHNHMQYGDPSFSCDPILAVSPKIMLNFDFGHYFGSTGKHPEEFIRKYHDRIFSMHTKDKTGPDAAEPNENQVWGQGQTPISDVLLMVKKEGWPIFCDIELEYAIKPWSTSVKEVGTCIKYAREILEF